MSQSNPVRIFITHAWENSDDYLRVFEYLESQRNFFYRNYSTPEGRPQGASTATLSPLAILRDALAALGLLGTRPSR